MTDPETVPEAEPVAPPPVIIAEPPAAPPPSPPQPKPAGARRSVWPLLGVIGFLLLAAGEGYLWWLEQAAHQSAAAASDSVSAGTSAQIADLQNQIAALQQNQAKAQPAPDSVATQADQSEKLAVLDAEIAALQTQIATDHATVTSLAASSADLTKLTAKIQNLNVLAAARMALDSGQPLGTIPNAPPALAAFATSAPPTMAQLILTYPEAAAAANAASVEKATKNSFWARVLGRLEALITISNGNHVLIGAPAAAITASAQTQLDAGDLAGAVATLTQNLSPSTQAAMAGWLGPAQSLLAARAAMIQMSEN
jgi:hypothetical protein